MHKAIFLDRDGVLNKEIGEYVPTHQLFDVLEHVPALLKRFQDAGYLLIVITNQGGIAKKLYTHDDLAVIHKKLIDILAIHDVKLSDIYYCPHHPEFSKCLCRKPGSLLLEKAIAKYQIDPSLSFMIGDKERDVEASEAVGVKGFLIEANANWGYIADEILN